ncbi:MAG TPA: pyridoxamine 5'-phosphate oxidase [Euzebyales bacterium]|nr:pyridoxamine 5'-phosphate oxidase [Euzebyales bacterium]
MDVPADSAVRHLRREYRNPPLDEADLSEDPLLQIGRWVDAAVDAGVTEPNAMTVATVGADGAPSARVVLLRGLDDGLVFYTSYRSRKGRELAADPRAAAVLCWLDLSRQIRVTGTCARVTAAESDAYWASRPPGSRLSAAASPQSSVIDDAEELTRRVAALRARHPDGDVPRPDHWGGFRLRPDAVELWQGRPDRLHERLRYRRDGGTWIVERLAP